MSAVKDVALVPAEEPQTGIAPLFERLALDPNASVDRIEQLMGLWERNQARQAKTAFSAAMSEAQREMRPVAADAENPSTRSRYASYAALDMALRPIYTKYGFGLSFNTGDSPLEAHVRVICDVTQSAGHEKAYHIDMPADGKGAKGGDVMTKTHATGSAVSYGMRYLLKMIFNVAVGEDDDDGNRAGAKPVEAPAAPKGYDDWQADMEAAATDGWPKLSQAFQKSQKEYRDRATKVDKQWWNGIKTKAERA